MNIRKIWPYPDPPRPLNISKKLTFLKNAELHDVMLTEIEGNWTFLLSLSTETPAGLNTYSGPTHIWPIPIDGMKLANMPLGVRIFWYSKFAQFANLAVAKCPAQRRPFCVFHRVQTYAPQLEMLKFHFISSLNWFFFHERTLLSG